MEIRIIISHCLEVSHPDYPHAGQPAHCIRLYVLCSIRIHEEGNKDNFPLRPSDREFNVKHVCTYMNLMKYHNKLGIIILVSA